MAGQFRKQGLTLIELMLVVAMFAILVGVTAYTFRIVLLNWSSSEERAGVGIDLDYAVERITRELREATNADGSVNSDEIRFTVSSTNYIYYLYNADDSYPPGFNQSSYQLRKATLSGGIGGTFTYGSGRLVLTDVLPPPASDLSLSANLITIDLSITRTDETISSRRQVRPRNL